MFSPLLDMLVKLIRHVLPRHPAPQILVLRLADHLHRIVRDGIQRLHDTPVLDRPGRANEVHEVGHIRHRQPQIRLTPGSQAKPVAGSTRPAASGTQAPTHPPASRRLFPGQPQLARDISHHHVTHTFSPTKPNRASAWLVLPWHWPGLACLGLGLRLGKPVRPPYISLTLGTHTPFFLPPF